MIYGAHILLYSDDADADRAFLREPWGWRGSMSVGAG